VSPSLQTHASYSHVVEAGARLALRQIRRSRHSSRSLPEQAPFSPSLFGHRSSTQRAAGHLWAVFFPPPLTKWSFSECNRPYKLSEHIECSVEVGAQSRLSRPVRIPTICPFFYGCPLYRQTTARSGPLTSAVSLCVKSMAALPILSRFH